MALTPKQTAQKNLYKMEVKNKGPEVTKKAMNAAFQPRAQQGTSTGYMVKAPTTPAIETKNLK